MIGLWASGINEDILDNTVLRADAKLPCERERGRLILLYDGTATSAICWMRGQLAMPLVEAVNLFSEGSREQAVAYFSCFVVAALPYSLPQLLLPLRMLTAIRQWATSTSWGKVISVFLRGGWGTHLLKIGATHVLWKPTLWTIAFIGLDTYPPLSVLP